MALRKILTDGDPALHKMCRPVTSFDARLHTLLDDLKETLADANGAGLAAPQVGILRRVVIVVDAEDNMLELVNPLHQSQPFAALQWSSHVLHTIWCSRGKAYKCPEAW